MTEREKFEAWASSQGWSIARYRHHTMHADGHYKIERVEAAFAAWLAAKQQAHCEALSDLHKLEQKVAHGCTDASCKECDK